MDYIDSMENYYKDDAELKLFDSLSTDIFYDTEENGCVQDPGIGHWLNGATVSDSYDGLVSDCMMLSDSMSIALNPNVQSEHSYSVTHTNLCSEIKQEPDIEFELETLNAINPNLAFSGSEISQVGAPSDVKQEILQVDDEFGFEMQPDDYLNCEDTEIPVPSLNKKKSPTYVVTCTTQLMGRQPTIIVTNARQSIPFNPGTLSRAFITKSENACQSATVSAAKDRIKDECRPVYILTSNLQTDCEETRIPLTPPASSSSCSSDSECSQSPKRQATNSPRTVQPLYQQQQSVTSFLTVQQKNSTPSSNGLPSSSMLVLTEEEKRTMIAEGYPVPTRFPLSKQEEKNLKKVQRKIKNKMSAQESRRKKKDYVDSLEKKLEASNQENNQLKKQLEHLASDNKSLLSQLHKLQSLANNLSPLQSSTCLAVFVLFFALGVGILSPSWSTSISLPTSVHSIHSEDAILQSSLASDYFTPSSTRN